MKNVKIQKPKIEEWMRWADIVIERLTDCIHIYKKSPADHAAFMPEAERQLKSGIAVQLLQRVHKLIDQSDTPSDSIADAFAHDEKIISGLVMLFGEILERLPLLSSDMQKLLRSPWSKNFPNQTAQHIFAGKRKDEMDGIGSGLAEHGRLPQALTELLEREQMGDDRHPREDLLRHGEPRRHDIEGRLRWTEQNSRHMRTAGRVE